MINIISNKNLHTLTIIFIYRLKPFSYYEITVLLFITPRVPALSKGSLGWSGTAIIMAINQTNFNKRCTVVTCEALHVLYFDSNRNLI